MKHGIPQLVRDSYRLLLEIEQAAAVFPRAHRYRLGNDLRDDATQVSLLSQSLSRAGGDRALQAQLLQEASDHIDRIKLRLQLAHSLQCYSLGRCKMLSDLARTCGRQVGGWLNQVKDHPRGQNPAAHGRPERA